MKKNKWMGKTWAAASLLVAVLMVGAMAPKAAGAVSNPRGNAFSAGDNTTKILKNGTFQYQKPQESTKDTSQNDVHDTSTTINTSAYQLLTSSGGIVTLASTPSVSTTTAAGIALVSGKTITLRGTSEANAVVIQDDDTLADSQVELGATSRTLGLNDILVLKWDAETSTTGRWLEVSYSNLD